MDDDNCSTSSKAMKERERERESTFCNSPLSLLRAICTPVSTSKTVSFDFVIKGNRNYCAATNPRFEGEKMRNDLAELRSLNTIPHRTIDPDGLSDLLAGRRRKSRARMDQLRTLGFVCLRLRPTMNQLMLRLVRLSILRAEP
jgi:hypothetical protein